MSFKASLQKLKRWFSGDPIEGETYTAAPEVKDLPHIVDADGALVAVSSGKRELSPVLSQTLNIQGGKKTTVPAESKTIDDQI